MIVRTLRLSSRLIILERGPAYLEQLLAAFWKVHPPEACAVDEAEAFAAENPGTEEPLALVLQREYIDEPEPCLLVHVKKPRMTEWPVQFLEEPRRTERTIPDWLALGTAARRAFMKGLD